MRRRLSPAERLALAEEFTNRKLIVATSASITRARPTSRHAARRHALPRQRPPTGRMRANFLA